MSYLLCEGHQIKTEDDFVREQGSRAGTGNQNMQIIESLAYLLGS
jgi:hypothetical protein